METNILSLSIVWTAGFAFHALWPPKARLRDQMPGLFDPLVMWVGCLLFSGLTLAAAWLLLQNVVVAGLCAYLSGRQVGGTLRATAFDSMRNNVS